MTAALAPLRILDLTQGVPGGYCTKLLAGCGAEVIKVEPPEGDRIRSVPPFWNDEPHSETGCLFLHLSTGKKSITLDIEQPGGAEQLARLIAHCDAVIESSEPGFMERLGFGYEALRRLSSSVVLTSITPFGQSGPYRDWKANELVSYALGGYAHLTGLPEREPIKAYGYTVEYHAGMHAAVATLAALWRSRARGLGEHVDVAVHDAVAYLVDSMPERQRQSPDRLTRVGTQNVGSPRTAGVFSELLPCADGYVHVHSPMGPAHHNAIAELIGEPDWLDPGLAAGVPGGTDVIDGVLRPWLADKGRAELVERAQAVNAPWTPVLSIPEVIADAQHEARGFFVDVEHPLIGSVRQPGYAILMSDTPWRTERAPLLGEHNDSILGATSRYADRSVPVNRVSGGASGRDPARRPLEGVRVLDLSHGLVGPVGGGVLADLGAEVIRIEQPARAAAQQRVSQQARPREPGTGPQAAVNVMSLHHHDKRHLSLDLRQPEGMDVFKRLIAVSDVVWENFSPRVMTAFGLECPVLQELNPGVIHVAMPAFGRTGPYRDYISMGPGADAISGLSELTGYVDGPPLKPGNYYADYMNGLLASYCVLAGLFARAQTGRGQHIEAAIREVETHIIGEALLDYALNGRAQTRQGNRHPAMAPHNVYPCLGQDRWLAIGVEDDQQWRSLVAAMGSPSWALEQRFASVDGRRGHEQELDRRVGAWTADHDAHPLMQRLQQVGVPAGVVLHPEELLGDPQLRHRGFYRPVPGTDSRFASQGWRFGSSPPPALSAPPEFGQDNEWVLRELLGLSAPEVGALREQGVISEGIPA